MPRLKSEIIHTHGQTEAIQRLKDTCEHAHSFTDLRETWVGNRMDFFASVQGVKINGYLEVSDDRIKFEAKVPLIAVPFKSWIPNILKHALKSHKPAIENSQIPLDNPLIFYLHIPKAGGTTLGDFIYNQCQNGDNNEDGLIKNGIYFSSDGFFRENETGFSVQTKNILTRFDLRAVIGHFVFGIHQLVDRPYQYITILRNPINRVISLYHYLRLEDKMSLEQFANDCPYREIDNDQTRRIAGINPEPGKCSEQDLERAKENLCKHFAFVGITERFDETLALLKLKFNWTKNVSSYPRNVNADKKQSDINMEPGIKAVKNRNLYDIQLYNYANQLMDEMIALQGPAFSQALWQQKELNSFKPEG